MKPGNGSFVGKEEESVKEIEKQWSEASGRTRRVLLLQNLKRGEYIKKQYFRKDYSTKCFIIQIMNEKSSSKFSLRRILQKKKTVAVKWWEQREFKTRWEKITE